MKPTSRIILKSTFPSQVTSWIFNKIENENVGIAIRLVNTYCLGLAVLDKEYSEILSGPGINLPDGKPLIMDNLLRFGGSRKAKQIRGADLMRSVLDASSENQIGHFFIGSTDKVLAELDSKIRHDYRLTNLEFHQPGQVSRASTPNHELILKIRNSNSKIVWVGLGTPNQDFFAQRLAQQLPVVVIAVGAAFDFISNEKKEAHPLIIRLGVEWVFRLLTEPKRLLKRYLLVSPLWLIFPVFRQMEWESL